MQNSNKTEQVSTGKIKVQHMLYSGLGGHGSVFFSLAEANKNKDFDLMAVFCGLVDMREDYVDKCKRLGIPFQYLRKKRGVDPQSFIKLYKIFSTSKPNIIFLHGVTFGIIPAFLYKILNRNTKIFVRDTQAHHLKTKAEWFWLFFAVVLASKIVVLTKSSGDGITRKFGRLMSKKKLVIIPNGIDTNKFSMPSKKIPADNIVIGMQSRFQPIKDHPTLLKAFDLVAKTKADKRIILKIAGDGETMGFIKDLIAQMNLSNKVFLLGMLDEKELIEFMKSLDIYVHATYGETLSTSIMQAMSFGLPIIASDVWGVNNMIIDGKSGLLYSSENAAQLADSIIKVIDNPDLKDSLSTSARQFAVEEYSNYKMYSRYHDIAVNN